MNRLKIRAVIKWVDQDPVIFSGEHTKNADDYAFTFVNNKMSLLVRTYNYERDEDEWCVYDSIEEIEWVRFEQCIGLKDIKGVLIYENDLLNKQVYCFSGEKCEKVLIQAVFKENTLDWDFIDPVNKFSLIECNRQDWFTEDFEVIGNIYENEEENKK